MGNNEENNIILLEGAGERGLYLNATHCIDFFCRHKRVAHVYMSNAVAAECIVYVYNFGVAEVGTIGFEGES